mmetsp:Transcript_34693/g.62995  ORF Transcript_34693/g.62995 Transcript_34693/m.62995 type:complete len:637 (+) Transcript_34693:27-1937(+)
MHEDVRDGSKTVRIVKVEDIPSPDALEKLLQEQGVCTDEWGQGSAKEVKHLWKEIWQQESSLEFWQHEAVGRLQKQVVRIAHVLRGKVSSPEHYGRGIFVFNTWQQKENGNLRTRNGLLAEKLRTDELPLEGHLHEVCQRAIEEEMQCLVGSHFKADSFDAAMDFDRSCIQVVEENLVDHTLETEVSHSFPGLTTVYHLYTVDIVCSGLPHLDFNTLEFDARDCSGHRKLKYVHAWVWLEWAEIRRYLFEGSKLAKRIVKGEFSSAGELRSWLTQFLDLALWGREKYRSVEDLYRELEDEETRLELWQRHDGVPLLMRVVHLLQMKVSSPLLVKEKRFLFQTWLQSKDGRARDTHRFLARKLSNKDGPLDESQFDRAVNTAILEELSYIVDPHFQLEKQQPPNLDSLKPSTVKVQNVEFCGHRIDVEESPSYRGMTTLYHVYTAEVICEGLPETNFASLETELVRPELGGPRVPQVACAKGWVWATWQECIDVIHSHHTEIGRTVNNWGSLMGLIQEKLASSQETTQQLGETLKRLAAKLPSEDADVSESLKLLDLLQNRLAEVLLSEDRSSPLEQKLSKQVSNRLIKRLPPSMVAKMAESTLPQKGMEALEKMERTRHRTRYQHDNNPDDVIFQL